MYREDAMLCSIRDIVQLKFINEYVSSVKAIEESKMIPNLDYTI